MSIVSLDAAAEILDCSRRHIEELIEAGELQAVDIAVHPTKDSTPRPGADGRLYSPTKRRLRVDAASIQAFIARRMINQPSQSRRRRRQPTDVIQFFS